MRKIALLFMLLALGVAGAEARNPFHMPYGGGVNTAVTPPVQPVISNLLLSNNTLTCPGGGATSVPSGTTLGTVAITETLSGSSTPFTGTLLLSGTNSNAFGIVGSAPTYSIQTTTPLACGQNVSFNIAPNQAGAQLQCPNIPGCSFNESIVVTAGATAPQIANVILNGNSFIAGSPSGTVIGTITDPMSSGSFTGTNTVDDTTHFQVVADNTLETNGIVPAGSYSINICGVMQGASNSPQCRPFTITGNSSGQANGNCASGATADGCVIFPGGTKTLVSGGNTWQFNNSNVLVNGAYTQVVFNGSNVVPGAFIDGGGWGDAIMLCSACNSPIGSNVYVRGWQKGWYNVSTTGHTVTMQVGSPSFNTVQDTAWLTVASGIAPQNLNITAPSNNLYAPNALTISVENLPTNGTVTLSDGVTPITQGQFLTLAQLTGLKFLPASAAKPYKRESSFAYLVRDPSQQGAVGYVGLTVKPSGLWADPALTTVGGAGVDFAPTILQPAATDDLIGIRVQNPTVSSFASGKSVYHGMVFMPGTVQPTDTLCAKPLGGSCSVYVQMDAKATNPDGSVRHAVLSFNIDALIASNGSRDFMFAECGAGHANSCPSAPTAAANNTTLAAGAEFASGTLSYTSGGTGTDSFSCKSILANANAGTGGSVSVQPRTTTTWLNGPVTKSYSAMGLFNSGKLKIQCDVYAFSDGSIVTDVLMKNDWAFAGGKNDINYTFSTTQDSYSQAYLQPLYTIYEHTVSTTGHIDANFQFDVPYLMATGAFMHYDQSMGIQDSWFVGSFQTCGGGDGGTLLQRSTGCYNLGGNATGNLSNGLGTTGPREEIGPDSNYGSQWLVTQDSKAFHRMMGNARMSGQIVVNFTDETTGDGINGDTITNFRTGTSLANGDPCDSGSCGNGNPFGGAYDENGLAHWPGIYYTPYVITGNHYLMELMTRAVDWQILSASHSYGSTTAGDLGKHVPGGGNAAFWSDWNTCHFVWNQPCFDAQQIRHTAWNLRGQMLGAYITPDAHSLKSFFTTQAQKGLRVWVNNKVGIDMDSQLGQLRGSPDAWFPSSADPNFHQHYYIMALDFAAQLGVPLVSPAARRLMQFVSNHVAGMVVHGQQGMPSYDGAAESYQNYCVAGTPLCSNGTVKSSEGAIQRADDTPIPDWATLLRMNNAGVSIAGAQPGMPMNQGYMVDGNCNASGTAGGGVNGGDCQLLLAAVAGAIQHAPSPEMLSFLVHAWSVLSLNSLEAFYYGNTPPNTLGDLIGSYQQINQFAQVPRLPDGKWLNMTNAQIQPVGSATFACTASPCALLAGVETGSTYSFSSTNSASYDIMAVNAKGGSQVGSSLTPGAGGGGGGTGTMTASTLGADTYMIGGCGSGTFNGGAGNDVIVPRGNCYGATGAQTVRFRTNTTAKTKQIGYTTDYAGTVGAFRPGTDTLNIVTNLDGTGVTTATSVMARCTTNVAGDAVFNFDGGITLKGVACNAPNLQSSITVN